MSKPYRRGDGLWAQAIELPPTLDPTTGKLKRRRKVVSHKDKGTVIKRARQMLLQLEEHGDLPTDNMTVAQWFDYWVREIAAKTRRPKTLASYQSIVKQQILPAIGHVRLDKLTPTTIRKVTTAMDTAGRSSTYQRNAHSIMAAAFRDAEREGRIRRNPTDLVQAPRKAATNLQALTLEEAVALLEVFSQSPEGALWATFILTGARRGEVLGLEWDRVGDVLDLSWQLQRITAGATLPAGFEYRHLTNGLYLTRPKTRAGWRVVPLVDPLKSILERYRDTSPSNPHGLLFTRPDGQPFDPDYITKTWPLILDAAGIDKKIRVHDLRHTTVDLLYAAGVPEPDILEIVGHSSRAMSRAYKSKGDLDRLRASMVQFSRSLER
ncbi:tyrosine-type recombinase/integrase [Microbacterium sp. NPDC055455]